MREQILGRLLGSGVPQGCDSILDRATWFARAVGPRRAQARLAIGRVNGSHRWPLLYRYYR
jgi:hypothetical protein